ncbi:MAG: PEP-CTERM sorting domain-containing protein [Planctomycetota bacterium]
MKKFITTGLGLILLPTASMAATLEAEGTFAFDSHVFSKFDRNRQSRVLDLYRVNIDPLTVAPGTYDRLEVTLRPAGNPTVLVDSVGFDVRIAFGLRWAVDPGVPVAGSGTFATPTTSFENPVGVGLVPPFVDNGTDYVFNATDIVFDLGLILGPGPFRFDGLTAAVDIDPFTVLSETTYLPNPDDDGPDQPDLSIFYITAPALNSDPGRFSSIVPEPTSLALLGAGVLALIRRRVRSHD